MGYINDFPKPPPPGEKRMHARPRPPSSVSSSLPPPLRCCLPVHRTTPSQRWRPPLTLQRKEKKEMNPLLTSRLHHRTSLNGAKETTTEVCRGFLLLTIVSPRLLQRFTMLFDSTVAGLADPGCGLAFDTRRTGCRGKQESIAAKSTSPPQQSVLAPLDVRPALSCPGKLHWGPCVGLYRSLVWIQGWVSTLVEVA